jgi:SAM-dependent methyltransferase
MNLHQKVKRFLAIRFPRERNATRRIISFWEQGGADFDYYAKAEAADWLAVFWKPQSPFHPLFQQLNLDQTLEIACGAGRHSAQVMERIQQLYLLDSSAAALEKAKDRFAGSPHVTCIHNPGGLGIPADVIPNASLTAVFSYDAMVHFEPEAVESYLRDSFRVLQPGGRALFHHSAYDRNPGGRFTDNPGWRNYMTPELFLAMAARHGFEVLHSEVVAFACPGSDGVTLLQKPA